MLQREHADHEEDPHVPQVRRADREAGGLQQDDVSLRRQDVLHLPRQGHRIHPLLPVSLRSARGWAAVSPTLLGRHGIEPGGKCTQCNGCVLFGDAEKYDENQSQLVAKEREVDEWKMRELVVFSDQNRLLVFSVLEVKNKPSVGGQVAK